MSSSNPAILARDLGKVYRIYDGQDRGWLKSIAMPFWRDRFFQPQMALADINLRIEHGEVVGVLGRNGSGKSTLLRLLAGISLPTSGTVAVDGQVRCLLATGISFNGRFSGRENILYGSAAMGIPVAVARERMEEIIEFSELGEEIEKPTMFYSTGMLTKLAFAVAFQEAPEILLLDEAMAAGDVFFQHKCDQRVNEIVSSGSTVVMATHSLAAIEGLCTHAVLLEDGRVELDGAPSAVTDRYREMLAEAEAERPKKLVASTSTTDMAGPVPEPSQHDGAAERVELTYAHMCGPDGPSDTVNHGEPIELRFGIRGTGDLPRLRFALDLMSEDFGVRVANTGTEHLSAVTRDLEIFSIAEPQGDHDLVVHLPRNPLGSGLYSWTLSVRPFDPDAATDPGPDGEYLRAARLAPFRSVSFPGHQLGRLRRMPIEPEVEITLQPPGALPVGSGRLGKSPVGSGQLGKSPAGNGRVGSGQDADRGSEPLALASPAECAVAAYCLELCGPDRTQRTIQRIVAFLGRSESWQSTVPPDELLRVTRSAASDFAPLTPRQGFTSAPPDMGEPECGFTFPRLARRVNGGIDRFSRAALEAHLERCLVCRAAELRQARAERAFSAVLGQPASTPAQPPAATP